VGDGVPPADVDGAQSLTRWDEWRPYWTDLGADYERRASEALAAGAELTAGRLFWYGAMAYHYAQFLWFHEPDEKRSTQAEKVRLYDRAAPLLRPAAVRLTFQHAGHEVPGYLRLPHERTGAPVPCVILLGGLESTKEESLLFEDLCLERGVATYSFDGPGQGEFFEQAPIGAGFEHYTSAAIDRLSLEPSIDTRSLAVLGRSLGGYYAVRSAASDERIKACGVWGAFFDISFFDDLSPLTRDGFVHASWAGSVDEARQHLQAVIDLSDVAPRLSCDTYVLHGGSDHLIPADQATKLRDAIPASTSVTWVMPEQGNHCCHNMAHLVRPAMADWLASRLHR
jgi:2,6-dihydroxypseudooxynicotine hydrolase